MKKIMIILFSLIFLTGCSNKQDNNYNNEKIIAEVKFFSSKIGTTLNKLNNIDLETYELVSDKVNINKEDDKTGGQEQSSKQESNLQSTENESNNSPKEIDVTDMQYNTVLNADKENIDWDTIRQDVEILNNSWSIVMLDLSNSDIEDKEILDFTNRLNQTVLSVENEDKAETLNNLSSLYSYIPVFLKACSNEEHLGYIEETKYNIYLAYTSATNDDWNKSAESLENAENSYLNIINDIEYSKNKEYKINKCYALLKDLQNSIPIQDKNLYFLKYKNLIETINTL